MMGEHGMNIYRLRLVEQTIQEASADFEVEAASAVEAAGCLAAARDAAAARASRTVEVQEQSVTTGPCQVVDTPVFYILLDEHGEERGEVQPWLPPPRTGPASPASARPGQEAANPLLP